MKLKAYESQVMKNDNIIIEWQATLPRTKYQHFNALQTSQGRYAVPSIAAWPTILHP